MGGLKEMMSGKVRLGYMGIPFSNTEAMALEFRREMNWNNVEMVALMSSKDTVAALKEHKIDFAVLAVRNSSAGDVLETVKSLTDVQYTKVLEGSEHIHHCLFARSKDSKINRICSHIQALGQCKNTLSELYPDAVQTDCSDTAYAAEMLSKGELPDDCGVICRMSAGEHYGLSLIRENIEDSGDNETYFLLIRL